MCSLKANEEERYLALKNEALDSWGNDTIMIRGLENPQAQVDRPQGCVVGVLQSGGGRRSRWVQLAHYSKGAQGVGKRSTQSDSPYLKGGITQRTDL